MSNHGNIDRNKLAQDHFPLVRRIAYAFNRKYPGNNVGDMIGAGSLGLVEAAQRYDPTKGEFSHYAATYIRGNILDLLGNSDLVVNRGSIRQRGAIDKTIASLRSTEGDISVERILEVTNLTEKQYEDYRVLERAQTFSVDALLNDEGGSGTIDYFAWSEQTPEEDYEIMERQSKLVQAMNQLPLKIPGGERLKKLVQLYYLNHLTYEEIGVEVDLTRERVRQLLGEALDYLKEFMGENPPDHRILKVTLPEVLSAVGGKYATTALAGGHRGIDIQSWIRLQWRNYNGEPLSFYRKYRHLFQKMTRNKFERFAPGLCVALRRSAEIDLAIPALPVGRQPRDFTLNEDEQIAAAYQHARGNMAETLRLLDIGNVGRRTIKRSLQQQGLKIRSSRGPPPLSTEEQERIKLAHTTYNGSSYMAVQNLPYSRATIIRYWGSMGLAILKRGENPHRRISEERRARIDMLYEPCRGSARRIAREVGVSKTTVLRHLRRTGKKTLPPEASTLNSCR